MNGMARAMWDKIDEVRAARGLNWAQFATLIGESDSRVSKWRSGTGEPDRHQLLRMSEILDLELRYLADDSLDEPQWELTEIERAVLLAVRALGDTEEALRRLVRPGPAWLPGSVRDQTPLLNPRPPEPRTPTVGHSVKKPQGSPKKNGTA